MARKKTTKRTTKRAKRKASAAQLKNLAKGRATRARNLAAQGGATTPKKRARKGPKKRKAARREKTPPTGSSVMDSPPKRKGSRRRKGAAARGTKGGDSRRKAYPSAIREVVTTVGRNGKRVTRARRGILIADKGPRFVDKKTGKEYSAAQIRARGSKKLDLRSRNPSFSGKNVVALGGGFVLGMLTADLTDRAIAIMVSTTENSKGQDVTAANGKSTGYWFGGVASAAILARPTNKRILLGGGIGAGVLALGSYVALRTSWVGTGLFLAGMGVAHVAKAASQKVLIWLADSMVPAAGANPTFVEAMYSDLNDKALNDQLSLIIDGAVGSPVDAGSGGFAPAAATPPAGATSGLGRTSASQNDLAIAGQRMKDALARTGGQMQRDRQNAPSYDQLFGTQADALGCGGGGCGGGCTQAAPCAGCADPNAIPPENGRPPASTTAPVVPLPPVAPAPTGTPALTLPNPAFQSTPLLSPVADVSFVTPGPVPVADTNQIRGLPAPVPAQSVAEMFGFTPAPRGRRPSFSSFG